MCVTIVALSVWGGPSGAVAVGNHPGAAHTPAGAAACVRLEEDRPAAGHPADAGGAEADESRHRGGGEAYLGKSLFLRPAKRRPMNSLEVCSPLNRIVDSTL